MYVVASNCKRLVSLQPVADVFAFWFQVGFGEAKWCFHQALVATVKSMYSHRGAGKL